MKKLVALFAATTMAMSLSVSAFAAPTLSDGKDVLTFADGDFKADQAQVTMMAYVVNQTGLTPETAPAYDAETMTMIALDQDSAIPNVKVDATKIAEGTTVVIKTSGSKGEVQTFVLEQTVTATGKTVTFMNGATATPVVEADGKVTLPTDVAWNGGTPANGYTFELYSWVTADGTEYVIGENTEIDFGAALTEDVILYAKYNTGIVVGEADGTPGLDNGDSAAIDMLYFSDFPISDIVGQPIYEGSTILFGDCDGMVGLDNGDSAAIDMLYFTDFPISDIVGDTIYLINGTTVEAVYVD